MINPISGGGASVAAASHVQAKPVDSDGDHDGSGAAASAASNIGPAVVVSLSGGGKPDMAQGDPDHDGK